MLYGKSLFTIDNKLSADSDFIVKTHNVMLSVRGTSYEVEYCPETEESRVVVLTVLFMFGGQVDKSFSGRAEK